ncbi:hypothetical protein Tco_0962538 [Tanacetum coccineum]
MRGRGRGYTSSIHGQFLKVDFKKDIGFGRGKLLDDVLKKVGFVIEPKAKVGSSLQVFHLFYADDEVFMGHWSEANIDTILRVLDYLAERQIGCAILQVPFSYLGSKVGYLMSRFNRSLPIYHMSLFKVPAKVLLNMEFIRCHFFNGIEHNGKKQLWVNGIKLWASKVKEVLSLCFLRFNIALLFKWLAFYTHNNQLYGPKLVKVIHGEAEKILVNMFDSPIILMVGYVRRFKYSEQGNDFDGIHSRRSATAPTSWSEELQYIQIVKIMEGISLFDSMIDGDGSFRGAWILRSILVRSIYVKRM